MCVYVQGDPAFVVSNIQRPGAGIALLEDGMRLLDMLGRLG
jgi:hypothetical protein